MPITVPEGVVVDIKQGEVTVTGPKGQLSRRFNLEAISPGEAEVARPSAAA